MISLRQVLAVERLDARGEGLARHDGALVAVPYALPGDVVVVERDEGRARLVEIETPGPDRVAPFCPHYGVCGGCAVQALRPSAYARWKEGLLRDALLRAGIEAAPEPLLDAHGAGRRRATFHARMEDGRARVGFMAARSHEIVEIEVCPVLEPRLAEAPLLARALAARLHGAGKPLDILVTATESGLDVDLRGHGPLGADESRALVGFALRQDLARLSNHGAIVMETRAPVVAMGRARVELPAGAFLQATQAGEAALAAEAVEALRGGRKLVDLFSGVGAFALRLAEFAQTRAIDVEGAGPAAAARAATQAGLKPLEAEARDLFRRPLSAEELSGYDGLVFDPPRAGAEAQARMIARSSVPRVVAVSCNAQTFARDASILIAGGYTLERVQPVDQFRHSPHLEIVARFTKAPKKKPRRLLG